MDRIGTELELFQQFIDLNRRTVLWKLDGLSDEQAKMRVVGSETTLLGIVNHLAHVERYWVQAVLGGQTVDLPWSSGEDADWILADDQTVASVVAFFQEEIAVSDRIIAQQVDLDRVIDAGGRSTSVRWVLLHLIEEIGRHAGHAEIIRELIDESTGYFPIEPRWGS